ncbi:hypothetical protein BC643_2305 [Mangrovibacterium diazotrophicum]|uniref:Uncharacterized protein n=1 Tax=Mangrovibacterium diazotrophicum TaxID=1261403 RepID=A0A419W919_9BACT|nr:hypothetical protein BC643_2305 [Mangrovibacterium diazotrophicum]
MCLGYIRCMVVIFSLHFFHQVEWFDALHFIKGQYIVPVSFGFVVRKYYCSF